MSNLGAEFSLTPEELNTALKFMMDQSSDSIALVDKNACFQYVNRSLCDRTGFSRDELLEMSITDLDAWYGINDWVDDWERVFSSTGMSFESRHKTREGRTYPVRVQIFPIILSDRRYVVAYARDISDETRILNTAMELEKRFNIIFDTHEHPIFILDDRGNVIAVNREAEKVFGVNCEKLVGKSISERMAEESRSHFIDVFPEVLKTDDYYCDLQFMNGEGDLFYTQCHPEVITDDTNEITSIIVFLRVNND